MADNTLNNTYITCQNHNSVVFELNQDKKKLIRCLYKPEDGTDNTALYIVLPEGIEEIGDAAFSNCDFIGDVILPDTIERISEYAFQNCSNLFSVGYSIQGTIIQSENQRKNELKIARNAFLGCKSLRRAISNQFSELFSIYADCPQLEKIYNVNGTEINVKQIRNKHHNHLMKVAAYYHAMGMNLTMVKGRHDEYGTYKTPSIIPGLTLNELFLSNQDITTLFKQQWCFATGIGVALGHNRIRAIDVDGVDFHCEIISIDEYGNQYFDIIGGILEEVLEKLGLPKDYPWVVQTGSSRGFHVLIEVDDIEDDFSSLGFSPNSQHCYEWNFPTPYFKRMELIWKNHLVLPPSISFSGNEYKFRHDKLPSAPPSKVSLTEVNNMINDICGQVVFTEFVYNDSIEFELVEVTKQLSKYASYGECVSTDYKEDSISWLKECDSPDAINSLAIRYILGKGVNANKQKALELFREAETYPLISFNLASLIACGYFDGTKDDVEEYLQIIDSDDFHVDDQDFNLEEKIEHIRGNAEKHSKPKELYLFFDTETTGTPLDFKAPSSNTTNWPRLVQLAWILSDNLGNRVNTDNLIIKPNGFVIPTAASSIHGITTQKAIVEGEPIQEAIDRFISDFNKATYIVGHNVEFDKKIVGAEMIRLGMKDVMDEKPSYCTMLSTINFCAIPSYNRFDFKYPKLQELFEILFDEEYDNAHNAMSDVEATEKCFWELKKRKLI